MHLKANQHVPPNDLLKKFEGAQLEDLCAVQFIINIPHNMQQAGAHLPHLRSLGGPQ